MELQADLRGLDCAVTESPQRPRVDSMDLLRGVVMVVMALDHARDFFAVPPFQPDNLAQTTPAFFFTRWVTHFCAPVFVFLAGTGAFLSMRRGKTKPELSRFLITRGLWLILLEVTAVKFGWYFNFDYSSVFIQVIWVLGVSMIVLAGLTYLPLGAIAVFGGLMVFGHNLLDGYQVQSDSPFYGPWLVLHQQAFWTYAEGRSVLVLYPLIPWIGVMAAGYAFGAIVTRSAKQRLRLCLLIGGAATLAFVGLRAFNIYGDPQPWQPQDSGVFTVMSFLNCGKYPASLLFLLMILGPAIAALALFERWTGRLARIFVVFGRVPLFYYLLYVPLIHIGAIIYSLIRFGHAEWWFKNYHRPFPSDFRPSLLATYIAWLAAVALLYPFCRWFAELKRRNKSVWLSYL